MIEAPDPKEFRKLPKIIPNRRLHGRPDVQSNSLGQRTEGHDRLPRMQEDGTYLESISEDK